MATDDFSGVTVAFDKASYVKGETMTLTVSGKNKHTTDDGTTEETVTISGTLTSESGATHTLEAQPVKVTSTAPGAVTMEDVIITTVVDGSSRTYTPKAGSAGHSVTAVA